MSPTGIHSIRLSIAIAAVFAGQQVLAQSTASQILEEVTVSGERVDEGLIQKETAAKSRSTVGQEYFESQSSGQTVFQSINLVPGVNFVNSDPYGSSGGNIRLRGFDGARIALLSDGIPLNDTGNYSIFTNQQLDSEIVQEVNVNLGTTDVDSPTAAATGGTINLVTDIPKDQFAGMVKASWGEDSYSRYFVRADTGEFGPWNTKAFFTSSWQQYDKFKGPGELEKRQINGRIYQDLGDGDFVSLAFHGNRNRNNFVRNLTKAQIARSGFGFDNLSTCLRAPGISGPGIQNDGMVPQGDPDRSNNCTNYFGVRRNPSDTANIRGQASIGLTDSLRWTFDPNFQYVLANGGGYSVIPETDRRLRGIGAAAPGADLNGDGDTVDSIGLYAPNNTNTRRYGLTTSLIWEIDETSTLRVGYTLDYGRHRQTGQFGPLDSQGNPLSDFAGRDGPSVATADGGALRLRDRFSVARLNQASLSYANQLFDDKVGLNVGVRAPFFRRSLNQFCFTQLTGSNANGNPGVGNPLCTTEVPTGLDASGGVTFAGRGGATFLNPGQQKLKFDELLPNVSLSYSPSDASQIYLSYAKGFAAPRTDNLYTKFNDVNSLNGEKTNSLEFGYRYQTGRITATSALWTTQVSDRIVSSFDQELGINIDRNVGDVDMYGIDAAIGTEIFEGFSGYLTGSYIDTEIQSDAPFNAMALLPTKGKELVETPEFQFGARLEYKIGGFSTGLQGKFVDERFSTDLNDESAPSYKVIDLDARYEFEMFGTSSYVQVNLNNLFDEEYLGNISSRSSGIPGQFGATATNGPQYSIGSPRTIQLTVETQF